MAARVLTSLAHGTFFGVGAVVATGLVALQRKASAIATMFTGLTVATLLGVPAGAWLGLQFGWRATFWAVAAIGLLATVVIAALVQASDDATPATPLRAELHAVSRAPVLLGLATTVLGYADVFTVYTYIRHRRWCWGSACSGWPRSPRWRRCNCGCWARPATPDGIWRRA